MSALFWDLDYAVSSSPPETPPLHFARSKFSFYDFFFLHCSLPMQDDCNNLDWTSSELTRLNPSRTRDGAGEWHMVTATRSLFGSGGRGERQELQAGWNYNSLPKAHFLQSNRESSAFSPYTKDIWLNRKDAQNIAESPRKSLKPHPLTQPGFYSPKIPRSKRCDAPQSTKYDFKGSPTSKMKEFISHTLPLPCSNTAVLKLSKPQKVKTSVVETPPLMRAVISQTSTNSDQPSKTNFNQLQQREDHHFKNEDKSLSNLQEHNMKLPENDQSVWSRCLYQNQDLFTEDFSTKDHLSINTHLFPEHQSGPDQPVTVSPSLQKESGERFSIKPSQGDLDQPHASMNQPDCSQKQEMCGYKNHVNSQVDMSSKNVFGQPRMIASLRAACSPRPVRKSTVLEDLKKLIVMDDTEDRSQGDSSCPQQKEAGLCTSTLSNPANQSYPESPALTPTYLSMKIRPKADLWEREQDLDSDLMPLPNTACHLDWNSLVQAAQAYETQKMATLLSTMSPVSSRPETPSQGTYNIQDANICYTGEDIDDIFVDFPDQLSHLEGMLRRLSCDLLKEKRDKVALLAEVLKLRISNQHLRDESLSAVEQLHKISKIVNTTP